MLTLTDGNVAQIGASTIISVISMTCWRTKGDSNWRYSCENISLRCRANFRSDIAKGPVEKNPQKGAKIGFAPHLTGSILGQDPPQSSGDETPINNVHVP
jgi:hypothetical protein